MTKKFNQDLVGGRIGIDCLISGFGLFVRFARLNCLRPQDYYSAFNLRLKRADDLSRVFTFSYKSSFAKSLGAHVPECWNLETWCPFRTSREPIAEAWEFRFCPSCLRGGYHSLMSQMPWLERCPWHGDVLRTTCPSCRGRVNTNGLSDRLLLQCCCGHDLFDTLTAVRASWWAKCPAQSHSETYLAWARENRHGSTLIAPAGSISFHHLRHVTPLPTRLQAYGFAPKCWPTERVLRSTITGRAHLEDPTAALHRLSPVLSCSPGILELPRSGHARFETISRGIAESLPPRSLSSREVALFLGPTSGVHRADRRAEVAILGLPCLHEGDRRFLDLSALAKPALQVAQRVANLRDGVCEEGRPETVDTLSEKWLLVAAVLTVLARAYSEGLRVVLSRFVPGLHASRQTRSRLTEPWVFLQEDDNGRLASITVRWVPYRGTD